MIFSPQMAMQCVERGGVRFKAFHGFCVLCKARMCRIGLVIWLPVPNSILMGGLGMKPYRNFPIFHAHRCHHRIAFILFRGMPERAISQVQGIASVLPLLIRDRDHKLSCNQFGMIGVPQPFFHHHLGHGRKVDIVGVRPHDAVGVKMPFHWKVGGQDGMFDVAGDDNTLFLGCSVEIELGLCAGSFP